MSDFNWRSSIVAPCARLSAGLVFAVCIAIIFTIGLVMFFKIGTFLDRKIDRFIDQPVRAHSRPANLTAARQDGTSAGAALSPLTAVGGAVVAAVAARLRA